MLFAPTACLLYFYYQATTTTKTIGATLTRVRLLPAYSNASSVDPFYFDQHCRLLDLSFTLRHVYLEQIIHL
jgi:hypothetical protein